jgi:hypothetical protein
MAEKSLKCVNANRCKDSSCKHREPHEPISNGGFKYSYHTCEFENTLMCGTTGEPDHYLDGICEEVVMKKR